MPRAVAVTNVLTPIFVFLALYDADRGIVFGAFAAIAVFVIAHSVFNFLLGLFSAPKIAPGDYLELLLFSIP